MLSRLLLFRPALLLCLAPLALVKAGFAITYAEQGVSSTDTIYIRKGEVRVTHRKGETKRRECKPCHVALLAYATIMRESGVAW